MCLHLDPEKLSELVSISAAMKPILTSGVLVLLSMYIIRTTHGERLQLDLLGEALGLVLGSRMLQCSRQLCCSELRI